MKYEVTIDGKSREVIVDLTPNGRASVQLDGAPVEADITQVPGGVSVRIGNAMFDVMVGGDADAMTVASGPHRVVARVESDRAKAMSRRKGGGGAGSDKALHQSQPRHAGGGQVGGGGTSDGDLRISTSPIGLPENTDVPNRESASSDHVDLCQVCLLTGNRSGSDPHSEADANTQMRDERKMEMDL